MTVVNPPGFPPPRGYSHGIVAEGRVLFVAGQIAWNEHAEIVSDGFADQFDRALANVIAVVQAAGGTPDTIARLTIFVTDKREYLASTKAVGERYRAHMGGHYPAMTLVEVHGLLEPGAKIEIEATAMLTRDQENEEQETRRRREQEIRRSGD
jgi:enamine deaminase RidA (YjgF/YER057c/UK114 family)